ncbi:hypothetical protein Dimus_030382, partial [Dionaea muscipula]
MKHTAEGATRANGGSCHARVRCRWSPRRLPASGAAGHCIDCPRRVLLAAASAAHVGCHRPLRRLLTSVLGFLSERH